MTVEQNPIFQTTRTALPYRSPDGTPTIGSSAPGTSKERADRETVTGRASQRQTTILQMLAEAGPVGLTYAEIADKTGWRGGTVTGALSVMHKEKMVAALKTEGIPSNSRNGCGIYVLPAHVLGRITRPFKSNGRVIEERAPQNRSHLTENEKSLIRTIRSGMNADSVVRLRATTLKGLLDALDRLNA